MKEVKAELTDEETEPPFPDAAGCACNACRWGNRKNAGIALAEYNRSSYDPNDRKKLFNEVFTSWYQWKYKVPLTAHTFNVLLDSAGVDRVTR